MSRETLEKAEQERIAVAEDESQKGIQYTDTTLKGFMLKKLLEGAEDEYLDHEKEY